MRSCAFLEDARHRAHHWQSDALGIVNGSIRRKLTAASVTRPSDISQLLRVLLDVRRVCTRVVVPIFVGSELLAREALSDHPVPIAFGADASRIEGVPGSAAAPQLSAAAPPTRLLGPPSAQRAEDLRLRHANV